MFSQLCRVRSRTLVKKATGGHSTTDTERAADNELDGEDGCQLDHCTFCKFRVCCQVTSTTTDDFGERCMQNSEAVPVTDNPAYGLSSKNWLEVIKTDDDSLPNDILNMEPPTKHTDCDKPLENLPKTSINAVTSQQEKICDSNSEPKSNQLTMQALLTHNSIESRTKNVDDTKETSKGEQNCNDYTSGKHSWTVLKHKQLTSDTLKNCDIKISNVIDRSNIHDKNFQITNQDNSLDSNYVNKTKKNTKDRPFPLSLMRPIVKINEKKLENPFQKTSSHSTKTDISRQKPVQKNVRERYKNTMNKETDNSKRLTNDLLGLTNPLSEIAQIKTEESIQEWLARIGESSKGHLPEDSEDNIKNVPWNFVNNTDEQKRKDARDKSQTIQPNSNRMLVNKATFLASISRSAEAANAGKTLSYKVNSTEKEELNMISILSNASKASPANVPMVVMQCSRLHSHIGSNPPFQQTSLPMGTLVTALYQESEWLYVQTPHGLEGFVSSFNCAPIGTTNEPAQACRRPWEPCDFPIQVSLKKKHEFGRQQGSYISTTLPTTNSIKQAAPFVSTVKMKTNFYSDRYFPNHTFKSKDSIKTAKTVTDILRNSPETKISNP